jgi:hypothetical protein
MGILLPDRNPHMRVRVINGHCLKCGYRLAWILVLGNRLARASFRKALSSGTNQHKS